MLDFSPQFAKLRTAFKAVAGFTPLVALTLHSQPVYAQLSANNVVSACSGVSLPASVVTDIMRPVITGIAAPLETRVNSVTGLLGALVGSPTPLTLGTTGLLNTAASGAPISLQVLNTNGQVVNNSDPCYSQAAGFTLKNAAGISIGGNQLTGLGSGLIATAGEVNSIAFGNNAQTAATALGSIALGTNSSVGAGAIGSIALGNGAQATAVNSIALGAGSTASRGGQTYTGFALSTPTTSIGEFSVGTAGSLRQITNVAPGSSANDAVNVAQLQSVSNAVTATSNSLTTLSGTVTALDNIAVKYDATNRQVATLGGVGGTTLTNVKAGAVNGSSTDAVNGSQLFATNTNVTNVGNSLTTLDGVAIKYDGTNHQLATLGGVGGTTLTNVKAGALTGSSTDAVNGSQLFTTNTNVTNLGNSLTSLTNQVTNGTIGAVRYSNSGTPTVPNSGTITQDVTFVGATAGTAVKLHNVADGVVGTGSTDAVNGGQLASTNAAVALNTGAISTLNTTVGGHTTQITANTNAIALNTTNIGTNTTDIANLRADTQNGAIGTVQFSSIGAPTVSNGGTPSQDMALIGGAAGAVRLHNVANGSITAGSTDAVNGGQLFTTNSNVTALGSTVSTQGSLITANSNAITTNATAITTLRNDANNGAIGPLRYSTSGLPLTPSGAPSQDLVLVGATPGATVKIHNLADGTIAAGSTDVVNGGQLFTTNTNVSNLTSSVSALDGIAIKYDGTNHQLATLGGVGGTTLTNVKAGAISATSTDAVNGSQIFSLTNSVVSLSDLAVLYDSSAQNSITLGGVGSPAVSLKNVADGAVNSTSLEAVNGRQLAATNAAVSVNTGAISTLGSTVSTQGSQITVNTGAINSLTNNVTTGAVGTVQFSVPGTPSQDMKLVGATTAAVRLHNVADGSITAGSTDAVNGGQIYDLTTSLGSLSDLAVQYDDGTQASVTFGAPGGAAVTLKNVANGVVGAGSTDAVNGSQLFATNQTVSAHTSAINTLNTNVSLNSTAITTLRNDANNGSVGLWRYSNPGTPLTPNGGTQTNDAVIVGAAPGGVRLHNVADGAVAAGSTDAVNGGQLFALSTTLNSVSSLAIQYDDVSRLRATLGGLGNPAVTLANVADGTLSASSTEAVNGRQLFATNTAVGDLQTDVGNLNQDLINVGAQVQGNTSNLQLLNTNFAQLELNIGNGAVGTVQYSSPLSPTIPSGSPSQDMMLVGATFNPVRLHNVANGLVANGSTDAVNGGQLFGVGNGLASLLGFTYDPLTNSFAGNFSFGPNQYNNVQNVFDDIYSELTTGTTTNTASKYFHTTSLLADSTASGADATAIGPNAVASGEAAIATGRDAVASGEGSVAIGDGATAQNGKAVSIGFANTASGNGAVAIGDPNNATGEGAIAMGKDNTATGDGAIALGNTNEATGLGATAIGNQNIADGEGATAIGDRNNAVGHGSLALGDENSVTGANALAIGSNNSATGEGSMAIGRNIINNADDTVAIGEFASVTDIDSIAIGNRSLAAGESSTAVGNDTTAGGNESSAFGDAATALGLQSTAIGSSAMANGDFSVSVGESSSALGFGGTSLGIAAQASGKNSTALGAGAVANDEASVALGAAASTSRGINSNYAAFGLDNAQSSQGEIAVGRTLVYFDPITGSTPTGERQITGVAAGSAATDAVNVSQLSGTAANLGNAFASSLGGGATYNASTGKLNVPGFSYNGTTYASINEALAAVSTQVGGGSGGGSGNSPVYDNGSQTSITLGGSGGTTVQNVAPGAVNSGSTDAVNGAQLAATNDRVTAVENGAAGTVQYSNASAPTTPNGGTRTNDVTLVGAQASAPVAVHNVAAGQVAAGSTDAVNGSQLAATNAAVQGAQDTATQALTIQSRSVRYDSDNQDSISLGATGGPAVALRNVAAGVSGTDAVNVSQMNAGIASAVEQANAYTDSRLAGLTFDLKRVSRNADAGSAAALAAAGMPQAYEAGKGMLAMGAGTYGGQSAVAVGFSKASEDGRFVIKAGATYNSRGKVGANAGIGWQL